MYAQITNSLTRKFEDANFKMRNALRNFKMRSQIDNLQTALRDLQIAQIVKTRGTCMYMYMHVLSWFHLHMCCHGCITCALPWLHSTVLSCDKNLIMQ